MKIILNTKHIIITMNPRNIKFQTIKKNMIKCKLMLKLLAGSFRKQNKFNIFLIQIRYIKLRFKFKRSYIKNILE